MQSIQHRLDGIQKQVAALIRKLEMLTSENEYLKKENNTLRKDLEQRSELSPLNTPNEHDIKEVKDTIDEYVAKIEECIQMLQ
jgi:regulator of replication initiation timing